MVRAADCGIQPAGYTVLVRFVMAASWQEFLGCRFRCFSESGCFNTLGKNQRLEKAGNALNKGIHGLQIHRFFDFELFF